MKMYEDMAKREKAKGDRLKFNLTNNTNSTN